MAKVGIEEMPANVLKQLVELDDPAAAIEIERRSHSEKDPIGTLALNDPDFAKVIAG